MGIVEQRLPKEDKTPYWVQEFQRFLDWKKTHVTYSELMDDHAVSRRFHQIPPKDVLNMNYPMI